MVIVIYNGIGGTFVIRINTETTTKDLQKVQVTCTDCGTVYEMSYATFRQRKKKTDWIPRCKDCFKKLQAQRTESRYTNMSEEERIAFNEKAKAGKRNMSEEKKQAMSKKISANRKRYLASLTPEQERQRIENLNKGKDEWYKNLSPEERQKLIDKKTSWIRNMSPDQKEAHSKKMSNTWKRLSKEEKEIQMKPLREGYRNWWDNISITDKEFHVNRMNDGQRKWWESLSLEEQEENLERLWERRDKWYQSLSDEEKKIQHDRLQEGNRRWWESLSDEEKGHHIQRYTDGLTNWWSNMDMVSFEKFMFKRSIAMTNINPNKNENDFMDILKLNKIDHQFQYLSNIEHPDFTKLFPFNPFTKGRIFPYHKWDFLIYTKTKNILVDVDGSLHVRAHIGINGFGFTVHDLIQFNDSQRPYQTDGLDAYIIKCYDDKLYSTNTVVENIKTKESMTLNQFMSILKFMNMSNKEKKEILKIR